MAHIARLSDYNNSGGSGGGGGGEGSGGGASSKRNGWTNDDAERLVNANEPHSKIFAQASGPNAEPSEGPSVRLTFWGNGFQVDDGPLRTPDDDVNKKFVLAVENGRLPSELSRQDGKVPEIHLVDKRSEQWVAPPPPAYVAFSGGGHTMSPSGSSKVAEQSTVFTPSGSAKDPEVDAAAPTCRISIRMADGKRVVGKFNTTHTVHDLQAFVDAQDSNSAPYQLLLGRPPQPIQVTGQSLEEAGLKNQSLIQKLE